MSRLAPFAVVTALSATLAATADAQTCRRVLPGPSVPTIQPIGWPQPAPTRAWYFGMSVQLANTPYGRGLQVVRVSPGAPAQRSGLEPGDVLLASGTMTFRHAYSNEHGVDLLQQSVIGGGIGGPAPTFSQVSAGVAPRIANLGGYTDLQVLDVRTGAVTRLRVYPEPNGGGLPAPTFTAPAPATTAAVIP